MPSSTRACITGIGLVTPLGVGREASWDGFVTGRGAVAPIRGWDTSTEAVRVAGQVPADFEQLFHERVQLPFARRFGRFTQFALMAGQEALEHAGLDPAACDSTRIGVAMGVGGGATHYVDPIREALQQGHPDALAGGIDHYFVIKTMFNAPAGMLTIQHGLRGPSTIVSAACASGTTAVATGLDWIRSGRADVVLVGGTDATVTRETILAYWKVRALTDANERGAAASRPFDRDRSGFVMAEAAAVMVLESEAHARARAARPLAWVRGAGMVSEAFKIATPLLDGSGMAKAMRAALADAGVEAAAIEHISAHAPSTPQGDLAEARAIHQCWGGAATSIPVTAPKSMFGHAIGASSAVQTALLALSLERGLQLPTANLEQQDPEIDLDVVQGAARASTMRLGLVNAFGFGGHNVSLVLERGQG